MADTNVHEDGVAELGPYELGYHLVPSLGEDDLALHVGVLQKAVESIGGIPVSESYPQAFVLAYTMTRLRGGKTERYDTSFFGWMRFKAPAGELAKLEDELRRSEVLVRHILFKLDPVALIPAPVRKQPAPTTLEKKEVIEEKVEVSEEELDKQIEQMVA